MKETLWLFSPLKVALPRWFTDFDWGIQVKQIRTGAFPEGKDLVSCMQGNQEVQVSGLARAVMECLFLAPDRVDLSECFHLMEGLTGLQPQLVQELLEACTSVKVKRLFIFLAQRAGHAWLQHIDKSRIDLGTGVRSFHQGGTYIPELGIIVPEEGTG
ncbi:MAG: type IV toxin-antitoxin system AbiEi family antitoxin domain-containing protein [Bacteroidota bacterium]